jgi:hypothetical protein
MFYFGHLLHRVAEKSPYLYLIYRVVLYTVCCVQCTAAYCVPIQVVIVLPDINLLSFTVYHSIWRAHAAQHGKEEGVR